MRLSYLVVKVQAALEMVNEIATNPHAPGASGTPSSATSGGGGGRVEERHTVPSSLVGRIIGHSGDTIKKIREASGCKVQLQNEPIPGTDEHQLVITGSATEAGGGTPLSNKYAPSYAYTPPAPVSYGYQPYMQQPPPGYMLVPTPPAEPPRQSGYDPSFAAQYAAYTGYPTR
ncbi:MAG: hypothetical protein SGPRY_001886 [Prymnesium sp.]